MVVSPKSHSYISENENAAIVIIYIWQKEGADF